MDPVKVGVIGCGNISAIYFKNSKWLEAIDFVACADLIPERAESRAKDYDVPRACSVEELLADPDIEVVLNLTIPDVHHEIDLAALNAGKSVYGEKPLALVREHGREILQIAADKGLLVGSAPDTFLGAGIQTCRKLIDDGVIGEPVAATAFMMGHGHERWHPDPAFYYQPGGGPMFDMGPYYLTALINLIGPVRRVTGSTKTTFAERVITSEPKRGEVIQVNTPTHIAGVMDFENGAVGTIITSFDVWGHHLNNIEIHGTEGSMTVPDPNRFSGLIQLYDVASKEWKDVEPTHGYADQSRAVGLADMARALRTGRPHRASGEMAYHVLDIMCAFHDASDAGRHIELESRCERPAALPTGLTDGTLD